MQKLTKQKCLESLEGLVWVNASNSVRKIHWPSRTLVFNSPNEGCMHEHHQIGNIETKLIMCRWWKSSIASTKTRPGADCGTDHELLLASFKIKLKRLNQTSTTTRFNLQNIPSWYTVAVKNRFAGLELNNRESEEL